MQLKRFRIVVALLGVWAASAPSSAWAKADAHSAKPAAAAQAPAPAAPAPPPADPKALPDYGGRDSAAAASFEGAAGAGAPSPLAQAGQAFEALVIVLVLIFGALYLLKRSGILEGGGSKKGGVANSVLRSLSRRRSSASEASPAIAAGTIELLGTQPLPGNPGACVHLLTIDGRNFLVGATSQSVTLMSEWENDVPEDNEVTPGAFNEYLVRQGAVSPTPIEQDVVETSVSEVNDRLREMLSRVRDEEVETSAGKSEL